MDKKISILDKSIECFKADKEHPVIAEYPNNIMVELTNACNLSCKMCYHKNMKRKIGFMPEELFIKVTEQAKELNIKNMGLDSIKFSIDAASKETYENIRIRGKWEKLIENIKLLRKLRDERNSKLRIFASFTITEEGYRDLLKYNSVFKDLIDETLQGCHFSLDKLCLKINIKRMLE